MDILLQFVIDAPMIAIEPELLLSSVKVLDIVEGPDAEIIGGLVAVILFDPNSNRLLERVANEVDDPNMVDVKRRFEINFFIN